MRTPLSVLSLLPLLAVACARDAEPGPCPEPTVTTGDETPSGEEPAAAAVSRAAEVRTAAEAPHRVAPHGKAAITLLAEGQNAFLGRLELAPNAAVPEHQDPTEEYIHVLEGTGVMILEGERFEVAPGTTIFMPAGATVSFQNGPERLVALQVFAGPGPARKYGEWNAPDAAEATEAAEADEPPAAE